MKEIERIFKSLIIENSLEKCCLCPNKKENYYVFSNIEYRILLFTHHLFINNLITVTELELDIINYKYINDQNGSYKDTLEQSNLLIGYWSIINNNENLKKYKKND